jgi:predicted acetyltransferase
MAADQDFSNSTWVAVIAAIATPIATVLVAYRRFRTNGISREEAKQIFQAALADIEQKRALVEESNAAQFQIKELTTALTNYKRRYEELRREFNAMKRRLE